MIEEFTPPSSVRTSSEINRIFAVAPMLDWTVRHCRNFHRMLTQKALLYTEMVTTGAILHGDRERHLRFDETEHPLAIQLGGSDPDDLARCCELSQQYGYDEVNLNVGCPSDRVQSGRFGACLMKEPELVATCFTQMQRNCDIPVTVKCRIGVDEQDEYADLQRFVDTVASAGCRVFIVHARKAWLKGLSPKENRDIPPLNYERVYLLKEEFPELCIVINGGITSLDQCDQHLELVDGVMLGREAYQNPYLLAQVDNRYYGVDEPVITREQVVAQLIRYIDQEMSRGAELKYITRHVLGLFQKVPGAKHWRRHLSQQAFKPDADSRVVNEALRLVLTHAAAREEARPATG